MPDLHCLNCDYNLRAHCTEETPTGECPECGVAFERQVLLGQTRSTLFPNEATRLMVIGTFFAGMAIARSFLAYVHPTAFAYGYALVGVVIVCVLAYVVQQRYGDHFRRCNINRPRLQKHFFWFVLMVCMALAICWSMLGCVILPCFLTLQEMGRYY